MMREYFLETTNKYFNPIKKTNMKKVILTIQEFLNFRAICERLRIKFEYTIIQGKAIVRADRQTLKELGY